METDNLYKVDNVDIPKTAKGTTYVLYNRKSLNDFRCGTNEEFPH